MATKVKTLSFNVTCPACEDPDANVVMHLDEVGACHCEGCSEDFTVADAIERLTEKLNRWQKVERWVAMAREIIAE